MAITVRATALLQASAAFVRENDWRCRVVAAARTLRPSADFAQDAVSAVVIGMRALNAKRDRVAPICPGFVGGR